MEVPADVPKSPRSPRARPTLKREGPKMKKDKQKATQPVCESPRKHQKKQKPTTQEKGKVVNLEFDEGVDEGAEDIDIEGVDPISKLPEYIPLSGGKVNVLLLPDQITFEGSHLVRVPHLKLEDWDLVDTEGFPHLDTDSFMQRVFYKDSSVSVLEPIKWIRGVEKARLLNLQWVSNYLRVPINLIVIKQLLCLIHNRCLWLEEPILIIDMLIHRITRLPRSGQNPSKVFGRKVGECDLAERMKDKFKLLKNPCRYSISSITDLAVKVAT